LDKFIINGGNTLKGAIGVSGAKNASLALLPATILAPGKSTLKNTPELNDVFTMIKLLRHIGAVIEFEDHILSIETGSIANQTAPYEHVKKMRASVYVLGPLLTRYGRAKVMDVQKFLYRAAVPGDLDQLICISKHLKKWVLILIWLMVILCVKQRDYGEKILFLISPL